MKKYISVLLTVLLALQSLTTIAAEPNSSDVLLATTPQTFSAIVPTELPVYMDKLGVITTAEDVVITNTSKGPIIVHDIAVQVKDSNWSMAHFTSDFTKFKVNSNIIGLQFNGDNVTSSGTTELNPAHWAAINGLESMALNYDAKLAAQSGLLTDVRPVKVVFTLKWHEAGKADIVDPDSGNPLKVGDNKILTFNFTNIVAEDNSVVWSSSDESVATVKDYVTKARAMFNGSKSCEITAVSVGTATITGTLKDGTSASMNVVVEKKGLEVGTKHVEGNYEYSYGERYADNKWAQKTGQEGWGVRIIDNTQIDYASPLTTIQGRPVTNMAYLFYASPASTLNLINWDTSNITDMNSMFSSSQATSINGLSNLDTSKVTDMSWMFAWSQSVNLDLNSFNTSNVTNMSQMFVGSPATHLKISNFDTSNVTNMSGMFDRSRAANLDLSSFDTSNVTNMFMMFYGSQATSLDLSSFDTSNVTNMIGIFHGSQATSLDVSSFNTSKVTSMTSMFYDSQATSINLSSFDTSNVTDMIWMFGYSKATNLNLNSFNTSKVTAMNAMFSESQATNLDLSSFDTSNVTTTTSMFGASKVKNLTARTQADANKYKASINFPAGVTVTIKS